tara:strand:- start:76986 stop:83351 length:6366 start_codon:yes stop_codon:yes gene_type:complete
MRKLLLLLMMSCTWLFSVGQGTVTTNHSANNGSGAITFNVSANTPVEITGISNVYTTGNTTGDVWVRVGGVTPGGSPTVSTANGWTQVITGATITGANSTSLVSIPFGGTKISLAANTVLGVCVVGNTRYQTGVASDAPTHTDGTLTITTADSVAYGGTFPSPTINPRRFVGSVTYALAVTGNCTPFTGFFIDSISSGAAKLNWTPGASNTSFKVEYGAAGFTPGTGTTVTGNYPSTTQPPVILTGLSPNTAYDVWIEEYCNTGTDTVGFPTPQGFTTTKLCAAPTAFTDSNLTSSSIDLGWAQAGSYNSAWILYGPAGTTPGSAGWFVDSVQSPATTYTITTLNSNTDYDIYLATNCGSVNGISDTVGPISITTPISGPQGLNCTVGSPGPLFSDDFESQGSWTGDWGTGTTASNWNYRTGGTGSSGTGPNGAHSGSQYIYTETSGTPSGANIEAISPRIDLSTSFNSAELSFWIHAFGVGIDTVKVQVGSTANGPWTTVFTNVGQIQTANADPWQNVGVNLDAYVGTAIHLRFVVVHGSGFTGDVGIDLVEVNSCQTCPNSGNPNLVFISSDSASFTWTGSGTSYDVNWGPAGFTQGSASTNFDSTSTNGIGIGGLSGNTAYDIYVRNDCSDSANGFGGWVGPLTFVTLCNPFTAPYSNNFDTDSLLEAPICWENALIGGTSSTAVIARVEQATTFNPAVSSPNYVRLYNFNADTTWLISPQFSDMSTSANRISFQARTTTTATGNDIIIGSVSSPGNRASFSAIDTITITNAYAQYVIDITTANGYNGTDEFIVIAHAGPTFRTYYIDDFVYEPIPSCNPPLVSSLGFTYTTATDAQVFWGSGSDGDTTFIEYGPLGFTPGVNSLGIISVTGALDTALITGLTAETDYEFYIQDSCFGNGTSPYVGPVAFKTACAITSAAILPLVDGFENYTSGPTFTGSNAYFCNPSYNWTFVPAGNGRARLQANALYYNTGAQAFTMDQSSFPSQVETNSLIMTVNLSNYTTAGGIELGFVIMDHSATVRPDDKVYVRGSASDPWIQILDLITTVSGTGFHDSITNLDIVGPITNAGQSIGAATQIMFTQSGQSQAINATCCEGYSLDDVSLTAVSCPIPTNLSATNVLDTAATLSWGSSASAGSYQYWFGPAGFFQGTTTVGGVKQFTTNSSVLVDTLREQICYEYLVRNVCAPGDTSLWAGPFQFCTPCSPISAPYFENWDGLTAQSKDLGCFTSFESPTFATSNFTGVTIQNSTFNNPISAPNYVELDNSSDVTTPLMLISPLTSDLTVGDKRLRFHYRTSSTFNPTKIIVGTISDPLNPATFNAIDSITPTTIFTEYIVELTAANGYNGTDNRFALAHSVESTFDVLYVDDLHYEKIPTCIRPDSLAISSISDTSATFNWVSNSGTGTNFEIEYGIGPLGDPGNTRTLVTGTTLTPNTLTPGTGYCVWVREICSPGDTSFWRGPECFSTLCPLSGYMAPYFTNFTGISIGLASGTPAGWENCWTHNTVSGSVRWESEDASGSNENSLNTGPFFDATTPGVAGGTYMYLETSTSGGPAELTSPLINMSNLNNPELEYYYHMFGATINYLLVFAEDANGVRTQIDSIGGQQQTAGSDPFLIRSVPLNSLTGTSYNFVFQGHRGTSFTGDISIDDVSIQEGVTCPRPTGLAQTASTMTSATIAWNAGTGNNFEVEYGAPGFTQGAGTVVTATASPYVINGLTAATTYEVYIREICAPGDTSAWAGPVQVATDLCAASSQCMFYFDLTDSFGDGWNGAEVSIQQNGIEVAKFGSSFTTGTLFQDSVALCNGLATSIILDPAGSWPSEIGVIVYDQFGAAIDSFTTASPVPATGDTLVSFTASCGFPCPDPTGLVATSNVGCDSIEVDWVSASGGSIIEFGPSGFAPGSGTMTAVVTAPYTLIGLSPATAYDIYVADTCTGDTSSYVMLTTSTANAPMPVAVANATSSIIGGQFTVYVDASGSTNATTYTWDFGNGVTGSGANDTVVFLGNGVYNIVLTATNACGTSTDTIAINVNIGLEDNPLANSLNVYPNPAQYSFTISFREVGSADVQITLRDAQGRNVINMNDRMQSGSYSNDIDVSGLARGIYMLEIKSGSLTAHRRVSVK